MELCSLHFADKDWKPDVMRRLTSAEGDHRYVVVGGWQPGHSLATLSCCTAVEWGGGAGLDQLTPPALSPLLRYRAFLLFF